MSRVFLAAALPIVVFFAVGTAMSILTGRRAALASSRPPDPTPLNMRLSYDTGDMDQFFTALGAKGLIAERRFLEADLIFPTLYGGALAASLWWLCGRAGWSAVLPLGVVIVGVVADWTENLVQLELLRQYADAGRAGLEPYLVRTASLATLLKLAGVGAGFLLLAVLTGILITRRSA